MHSSRLLIFLLILTKDSLKISYRKANYNVNKLDKLDYLNNMNGFGDQNKINMPLLSDDQLQEINEKVSSKISKNILTDLDYWKDGYIYSIQCYINKIDEFNGFMIITNSNSNNKLKIPLSSIVSVQ